MFIFYQNWGTKKCVLFGCLDYFFKSVAIEDIGFELIEHSPFSSDMAYQTIGYFLCLKTHIKGIYFQKDDEVKTEVRK